MILRIGAMKFFRVCCAIHFIYQSDGIDWGQMNQSNIYFVWILKQILNHMNDFRSYSRLHSVLKMLQHSIESLYHKLCASTLFEQFKQILRLPFAYQWLIDSMVYQLLYACSKRHVHWVALNLNEAWWCW